MSLSSSVGFAYGTDGYRVGANACQDALDNLNAESCDAALIFSSAMYDHASVLDGVKSVCGDVPISGTSSNGGITHNGISKRDVVVVVLFRGENVTFASHTESTERSLRQVGETLGRSIKKRCRDTKTLTFIFSGELNDNCDVFMDSLKGVLKDTVTVVGGSMAGDEGGFVYQYTTSGIMTDTFTALSLSGEFDEGVGVSHGWSPIGRSYDVTHCSDNVLFTIEGMPAIDFYKEYFGNRISKKDGYESLKQLAQSYPLGIRNSEDGCLITRHPVSVNYDGSVSFNGVIPKNSQIQIMIGSPEGAGRATQGAIEEATESLTVSPRLVLVFQGAHQQMLPNDSKEYLSDEVKIACGNEISIAGCLTQGEYVYVPQSNNPLLQRTSFHNSVLVVCAL